eukprot:s2523_g2.t1
MLTTSPLPLRALMHTSASVEDEHVTNAQSLDLLETSSAVTVCARPPMKIFDSCIAPSSAIAFSAADHVSKLAKAHFLPSRSLMVCAPYGGRLAKATHEDEDWRPPDAATGRAATSISSAQHLVTAPRTGPHFHASLFGLGRRNRLPAA